MTSQQQTSSQSNESAKDRRAEMACGTIEESQINDVAARIHAMRSQEENAVCRNYLTTLVDASCRMALVDWCFTVVDSLNLSRETVGISMSILDRYISSGKGKSTEALRDKHRFQLAAITSFYMAVKLHEPVKLDTCMVVQLCRGFYTEGAIIEMELDLLHSLEWRLCVSTLTPIEYVRHLMQLVPELMDVTDTIQENAMKYMDCATADLAFSTFRASAVGIACLAGALNDTDILTPLEKESIWHQLSINLDFDIASNEIRKVKQQLLSKSICREPVTQSRPSSSQCICGNLPGEQPSSPVSVVEGGTMIRTSVYQC